MWKESVFLCLIVFLATKAFANSFDDEEQLEKYEIIEAVNSAGTTWKAGRNFHPILKKGYAKILLGLRKHPNRPRLPEPVHDGEDLDLPETFDAREKWSHCKGLHTVQDQSNCGSCWAVASASVFSDRLCIASKDAFNGQLSASHLMSCDAIDHGCNGGDLLVAFQYFETNGIVTGGEYNSHEGCQPYPLPNCDHHVKGKYRPCDEKHMPTLHCQQTCTNEEYTSHPFKKDLHLIKTNSSFSITFNNKKVQAEIYKNGPVVAGFLVYEDFYSYKRGVYIHKAGKLEGGHAVKIIGWGIENGTDYWLVANSWNQDWGNKGFFKIRRGTNECGFEEDIVGGMPVVHSVY